MVIRPSRIPKLSLITWRRGRKGRRRELEGKEEGKEEGEGGRTYINRRNQELGSRAVSGNAACSVQQQPLIDNILQVSN